MTRREARKVFLAGLVMGASAGSVLVFARRFWCPDLEMGLRLWRLWWGGRATPEKT